LNEVGIWQRNLYQFPAAADDEGVIIERAKLREQKSAPVFGSVAPAARFSERYRRSLSVAIGNVLVGDLVDVPVGLIAHLAEKMLMGLRTAAARYCAASKPFRETF
jgi:hypothetical protein